MSSYLYVSNGLYTIAHDDGHGKAVTDVNIKGSDIQVPVYIESDNKQLALSSSDLLKANANYTSSVIDMTNNNKILGSIATDKDGILYILESDDQTNYYLGYTLAVSASQTASINGKSYDSDTAFCFIPNRKYIKVIYVNGATDQTKFNISAYTQSLFL